MKISFSPPDVGELEIEQVAEALKSGWITTGPKTKELEKKSQSFAVLIGLFVLVHKQHVRKWLLEF